MVDKKKTVRVNFENPEGRMKLKTDKIMKKYQ